MSVWACTLGAWHGHIWVVKLCPKNLCVTNVAFLGLPSLHCVFWNNIEIFLEVLMAMVAQTSQVSKRALLSLLISPCSATTWHVDPWHICVVLNSCVPRIFVPQRCFFYVRCWNWFENLSVGNVFSWRNTCTRRPNAVERFLEPAEISTLCQNMWHI